MLRKSRKAEKEELKPGEEAGAAAEAAPPADPLEEARQALAGAQEEAAKNWDLYLRERAEMENFRKRAQRDKEESRFFDRKELLLEVLPVLDNLERALEHAAQGSEGQALREGVTMIAAQFRKAVENLGARPIEALGTPFDANLHQAMAQAETAEQAPGTVVSEFQRGYLLQERLLRPALVVVAKAPAAPAADTNN